MEQYTIDISDYSETEQNILKKYIGYTGLHGEIVERNKSKITTSTIHMETGIPEIVRYSAIDRYNKSKHTINLEEVKKNCWEISFGTVNKSINALDNTEKEFLKYIRENHPDYKTFVKIVFDELLAFCQNKTSVKTNNIKSKHNNTNSIQIHYKAPKVGPLKKYFQNDLNKVKEKVRLLESECDVKLKRDYKNNRLYDPEYDYYYGAAFKEARNRKTCTTPTPKKWLVWLSRYEYLEKLKNEQICDLNDFLFFK